MAVLGGHAKFRAFDANGAPLNGGKLYTYQPGTTTNKATYTDADEGTANTNPVILDSRGEADVWWTGKYNLVLTDSEDVQIWTKSDYDPATLDLTNGILDANGNELVTFVSTADAVNNIEITNQSTGNSPTIAAVGDDTNIDLVLAAKGSGVINFSSGFTFSDSITINGVAANAANIVLGEDTSNGTDTLTLRCPASLAADREITFPSAAPTNTYFLQTDASGVWSYVDVTATDLTAGVSAGTTSDAGILELATSAEVVTGTDTARAVTASTLGDHVSASKGWIKFNGTGTIAINDSNNVTSITDNGTGDYTVTWDTDFADADYSLIASCIYNSTTDGNMVNIETMAAGSCVLFVQSADSNAVDASIITAAAFGGQ